MADSLSLPLEAHENRSVFLEHVWNIGRSYRNQAVDLISICQHLCRLAPPQSLQEDAEQRRMRRACDLALRSAADSGMKVTDEASARFEEATQMLNNHSVRRHYLDLPQAVCSKMEVAKRKDSVQRDWSRVKFENEWGPSISINFVLLRSPLLTPHDPETVVVSQELSASPSLPEILWNFSRYKDRARITLEQNPHFYLRFSSAERTYTPMFQHHPLQDASRALEHNDTVYVLFDSPCRVFLNLEHKTRIFGNVWSLNNLLVFRDCAGVLKGEELIKNGIQGKLWYFEQPVHHPDSEPRFNHRYLLPIQVISTPLRNTTPTGRTFEDWTFLSRPPSRHINIHIYCSPGSPGSASSQDPLLPPPTSERPGYPVYYTTINTLNNDILLGIFFYYRLCDQNSWDAQLGWCKLSHVCRSWRHLVLCSAFLLRIHIPCTNGSPTVDTLDHIPPVPLFVDYRNEIAIMSEQDEFGIFHALRLRDRVRRIVLHIPPSTLQRCLMLMHEHESFPTLERLSLSSTVDEISGLIVPKIFSAPNLRHLTLNGVGLPKRLRLLSSTISLVTLVLTNIRASGYFRPRLLAARLQLLPQLEELFIGFSIPIPRPSTEGELLGKQGTPVTLPNLKLVTFQGVSSYLERFIAQIRAPLLERLDITLFGQIVFALSHLSHFTKRTEGLKLLNAEVLFWRDVVCVALGRHSGGSYDRRFVLRVKCRQLDWQIDCAAQTCRALMPVLAGIEMLTLDFHEEMMPTEWQGGEIDDTTWHELLRSFVGVKKLRICSSLSEELSRVLQVDEIASDPGLLPGLDELISEFGKDPTVTSVLFRSFIYARQVAGHPVDLSFSPIRPLLRLSPSSLPIFSFQHLPPPFVAASR